MDSEPLKSLPANQLCTKSEFLLFRLCSDQISVKAKKSYVIIVKIHLFIMKQYKVCWTSCDIVEDSLSLTFFEIYFLLSRRTFFLAFEQSYLLYQVLLCYLN